MSHVLYASATLALATALHLGAADSDRPGWTLLAENTFESLPVGGAGGLAGTSGSPTGLSVYNDGNETGLITKNGVTDVNWIATYYRDWIDDSNVVHRYPHAQKLRWMGRDVTIENDAVEGHVIAIAGKPAPANDPDGVGREGGVLVWDNVWGGSWGGTSASQAVRWEYRAQMQAGNGFAGVALSWPNSVDWPQGGEIDIVELYNGKRTNTGETNLHYADSTGHITQNLPHNAINPPVDWSQWMDVACEWIPTQRVTVYCKRPSETVWQKLCESTDTHVIPHADSHHLVFQIENADLTQPYQAIKWKIARLAAYKPAPITNHAPVAQAQSVSTPMATAKAITLAASDPDSGDTLTYAVSALPAHGALGGTAPHLTYTPAAGFVGSDSFAFTARDNHGATSAPATVSIAVTAVAGTGTGLAATYYARPDLTGAAVQRTDASVDFDWGSGSPAAGIGSDGFSVRWSGKVQAQYSQPYTFHATADDGVRLWVDGRLLIDAWRDQSATEYSGSIDLVAGRSYDLALEYYENAGSARARLAWSGAATPKQTIPRAQLYPQALPPAWTARILGGATPAGSVSSGHGVFTVTGAGADIWGSKDAGELATQPLSGDGTITARVAMLQDTDPWAKAGVMIRAGSGADARHAFCCVTSGNGVAFQRRTATGGTSVHTAGSASAAPRWVRLVRRGGTITGYESGDGQTWTQVGSVAMTLANPALIGLAVTSHHAGVLCSAVFDHVSVVPGGDG